MTSRSFFFLYSLSLWTSARSPLRLVTNILSKEVISWADSGNDAALLVSGVNTYWDSELVQIETKQADARPHLW